MKTCPLGVCAELKTRRHPPQTLAFHPAAICQKIHKYPLLNLQSRDQHFPWTHFLHSNIKIQFIFMAYYLLTINVPTFSVSKWGQMSFYYIYNPIVKWHKTNSMNFQRNKREHFLKYINQQLITYMGSVWSVWLQVINIINDSFHSG